MVKRWGGGTQQICYRWAIVKDSCYRYVYTARYFVFRVFPQMQALNYTRYAIRLAGISLSWTFGYLCILLQIVGGWNLVISSLCGDPDEAQLSGISTPAGEADTLMVCSCGWPRLA